MIDPLDSWTAAIDSLPKAASITEGTLNLATTISGLEDKVQAGATGSPGILTTNSAVFATALSSLSPSLGTDWVDKMVAAWQAGLTASVITPGTVVDPAWTASGVDVLTLPSVPTTVVTLSAATDKLKSELMELAEAFQGDGDPAIQQNATEKLAASFRNATLEFQFNCIGLVVGTPPVPLPKIFSAE